MMNPSSADALLGFLLWYGMRIPYVGAVRRCGLDLLSGFVFGPCSSFGAVVHFEKAELK